MSKLRTMDVVRDVEPEEGEEPLRATIRTNLSFDEIDSLRLDGTVGWGVVFQRMAPYVVAWNAKAVNAETGEREPVPPPAEIGPDIFGALEPQEFIWLVMKVRSAPFMPENVLKKGVTPSEPMHGGPNGNGLDSQSVTLH